MDLVFVGDDPCFLSGYAWIYQKHIINGQEMDLVFVGDDPCFLSGYAWIFEKHFINGQGKWI